MNDVDFTGLLYDPCTGLISRKTKPEKPVGTPNKGGYLVFKHGKKLVYVHRVAFFLHYGYCPALVDHINRDRSDNKAVNLRDASAAINAQNRLGRGFTKPKQTKRWAASIMVDRKRKHLGYFDTQEEAHAAYVAAKQIYHATAFHSVAS